jgi:ABC-type glutathione transport system ATPase component
MDILLKIRGLTVEFCLGQARYRAVDAINLDVGLGEIVGLMGESGSGKSTTALAMLGLLPGGSARVTGSAIFRGRQLFSLAEREWQKVRGTEISLVFQEPEIALNPVMRAGDQVAEVIRAHHDWGRARCRAAARTALARVGLGGDRFLLAYPHQLSGGQRQRVVLAQALACEPALLIADEPTASLDARNQAEFLHLLEDLRTHMQLSVLLISHSPEVQAALADRLVILQDGQILEEGSFGTLCHSAHRYTRKLLGVEPIARPRGAPQADRELSRVS